MGLARQAGGELGIEARRWVVHGGPAAADHGALDRGGIAMIAGDEQAIGELDRLPHLQGALDRLIATVETELGGPLHQLSREDKQRAVRLLDQSGAFILRRAVEDVADAMGVSRITVYNYLNALHR